MKIRKAGREDLLDLLSWRNDFFSRQMFKSNQSVTLQSHKKWFYSALVDPRIDIYLGVRNRYKVGVCRFNFDDKYSASEVSINLNPEMRGENLSYDLLSGAISIYRETHKVQLNAIIKKSNEASIKIFQRCGFLKVFENADYYYYSAY